MTPGKLIYYLFFIIFLIFLNYKSIFYIINLIYEFNRQKYLLKLN